MAKTPRKGGKEEFCGVSVGHSKISVATFSFLSEHTLTLTGFHWRVLPPDLVSEGKVAHSQDLKGIIFEFWEKHKFPTENLAISIGGCHTLTRQFTIPSGMNDEGLPFEVEPFLPLTPEEMMIDVVPLGEGEGGEKQLLVAAKRREVEEWAKLFEEMGFGIGTFISKSVALANLQRHQGIDDDALLLMDIGRGSTTLVWMFEGDLYFSREIPYGGMELITMVAEDLGISKDLADEKLQKEPGSISDEVIERWTKILIQKAGGNIDYCLPMGMPFPACEELHLSGGGSLVKGIDELLEDELECEVTIFDNWGVPLREGVDVEAQALARSADSLGAAITEAELRI
jgi:type IV pilus assembly protein PilM